MTRLGQMLFNDGKVEGEMRGQSKVMMLIHKMSEDGALESIPRLSEDPEFYRAMLEKYGVEV